MTLPRIDEIGRLIGDPTRATILDALMDGRAWTGRELTRIAHVTPSTASEHLQRLIEGALVTVVPSGKYRYYRLASSGIASALEGLTVIAARTAAASNGRRAIDPALRRARTCYDHLAGELGVALADALIGRGAVVVFDRDAEITPAGAALFADLGLTMTGDAHRAACRPCLDWSERRFHLAGRCGAALARCALEREWVRREAGTRAVAVTGAGVRALREHFAIAWEPHRTERATQRSMHR